MDSIRKAVVENLTFGNLFAKGDEQFKPGDIPDQSGKVALVTGGSEGIGFGCSHELLKKNLSKLYFLSVRKDIADSAIDTIKEDMGSDVEKKIEWIECDLTDWKQTAKVADDLSKRAERLDILILGAARGIMTQEITPYGCDRHMALNHVGHVVLTSHLLPLLKKTATDGNTVRVVTFSSNIHENAGKQTKFETLEELNTDLGPMENYGRSKLAQLLYAKYLGRHLTASHENILVNSVHPGFVATRQSKEHILEAYPIRGNAMKFMPLKKDIYEGALSALYAATVTDGSGQYIVNPSIPEDGSEMARDEAWSERLMKLTQQILKSKAGDTSKMY